MASAISQFPSPLASGCLRWPTNPNSLSIFPRAATTILTNMARSKRLAVSSLLQAADSCYRSAHRPCSGRKDYGHMNVHGPMPRSTWVFPGLAVLLFAAVTAVGYPFAPTPDGFLFAAALPNILVGT